MRKQLVFGLLIVTVLLSMTMAACSINQTNAEQIALKYKYADESLKIYGPYTYELNSYYVAEFYQVGDGDFTQGVLIINEETGELLRDKEIAKRIFWVHFTVKNNNVLIGNHESLAEIYNREASVGQKNVQTIENASELMKNRNFEKMIEIEKKSTDTYANLSETVSKIAVLEKKIEAGDRLYENAMEIKKLNDEYISLLEKLLGMDEEYKTQLAYYYDDIGHTPGYNSNRYSWDKSREEMFKTHDAVTENRRDELELEKENRKIGEEYISSAVESIDQRISETPDEQVPGFSLLFAICSMLIVGILIKRRN